MKIAIVYYSKHHGNTKKLLDAINGHTYDEITLIDVSETSSADLEAVPGSWANTAATDSTHSVRLN